MENKETLNAAVEAIHEKREEVKEKIIKIPEICGALILNAIKTNRIKVNSDEVMAWGLLQQTLEKHFKGE